MARILIVDDDQALRTLYRAEFEDDGHVVTVVDGGRSALRHIRSARIDLVVLDLHLADIPGVQVLRSALQECPSLPIVINSAYADYRNDFATWSAAAFVDKSSDSGPLKAAVMMALAPDRVAVEQPADTSPPPVPADCVS